MRRILVSAIGGDVGHSILKCLKDTNDYLIGCDMVDYPVGLDLVSKYVQVPRANDSNYIEYIIGICVENNISHFIPVSEPEIDVVSHNLEKFEESGIKVLVNTLSVIDICLDKFETSAFLSDNKFQNLQYCLYDDFVEDGNQYIMKLRRSCGSKLLKVFRSKSEVEELIQGFSSSELLVQEYIDAPKDEYTVGVFGWDNDYRVIIFKRKLQGGFTKFVELVHDLNIKTLAINIAKELKLRGSINIQLRKKDDACYIFEINPRLSGTTNFRNQLGFKDVLWWLDAIDDKNIPQYVEQYKSAVGIREMNEKFLELEKF